MKSLNTEQHGQASRVPTLPTVDRTAAAPPTQPPPRQRSPKLSIVVPTYAEAENLAYLIPRIHDAVNRAGIDYEIIVVDDNSPDETREVCQTLGSFYPLKLMVREGERGLSTAVMAGMRAASGDLLLCLDADLSHPPEKIPALVAELADDEVDFVIGSRYVNGGETADDWGLSRWLNSKVAGGLARPLTAAKDPMAGFFALRKATFDAAEPSLDPIGYKIGLELIVKGSCRNVREVPIFFADRLRGESKLNLREQLNYLRHLKRLYDFRFKDAAYLVQFALVGTSGLVVDLAVFAMALAYTSSPLAGALAIWIAMTWNFAFNRWLTFAAASRKSVGWQYLGFCSSCSVGALLNWLVRVDLCEFVPLFATRPLWAASLGAVVGMASNFLLCRFFVFKLRPGRRTSGGYRFGRAQIPQQQSGTNQSPADQGRQ